MPFIVIIPILLIFFIFGIFLYYLKKRQRKRSYLQKIQEDKFNQIKIEFIQNDLLKNFSIGFHPDLIKKLENNLSSIYLVHGTFVGEDPFHLIEALELSLPHSVSHIAGKMKKNLKKGQDLFTGDKGNFTQKHVEFFEEHFSCLRVNNFNWSSGNHHYARIKGMIRLAKEVRLSHANGERVLLIGHSHAGQVFALLTQFINDSNFFGLIKNYFADEFDFNELKKTRSFLKTLIFDIVTLGTPPRYGWKLSKKIKVIHFINHRGDDLLGGQLSGVLNTRDGDYIQQWGITGSDFLSPIEKEKKINLELDKYFGVGIDRKALKEEILKRNRAHSDGIHFFVDYADDGQYGNFLNTIFGHGVYTKISYLHFHLQKIAEVLYR